MSKEAQKEQCCYGGIAHDCHAGVGCRIAERLTATPQQPAQQDIPDLIAGALGVSRGTAYDMMREALAEQPAREWVNLTVDELIDLEHKHLRHEALAQAIEAKLKEKNT